MRSDLGMSALLFMLVGQVLASPIESMAEANDNPIAPGCHQGSCPDSRFGLDLLSSDNAMSGWDYTLRWKGNCGCDAWDVSSDGCKTFTICSGKHSVCMDWRRNRAHWVDPSGHRTCYSLATAYTCLGTKWEAWPTGEVSCNW